MTLSPTNVIVQKKVLNQYNITMWPDWRSVRACILVRGTMNFILGEGLGGHYYHVFIFFLKYMVGVFKV